MASQGSPQVTPQGGRSIPLSDLPELTPWLEQEALKQQLLTQSGGGDAFVALAAPMLKRSILGVDPQARLSTDRGQLKALLRRGVTHDQITRAFAEASGCTRLIPCAYRAAPGATDQCWCMVCRCWCWAEF